MSLIKYLSFTVLLFSFALTSCKHETFDVLIQKSDTKGVSIKYPEDSTFFPPEFPAPSFTWSDKQNSSAWDIRLSTHDQKENFRFKVKSLPWKPDSAIWEKLKKSGFNKPIYIEILGIKRKGFNRNYTSGKGCFLFSSDSVGVPVFYRSVPLPFGYAVNHVNEIEWYSGKLNGERPVKVLDNIPVCANCHSFSGNGKLAMDVDYANDKGSYIIVPAIDSINLTLNDIITWNDFKKEDGENTYGLLSQISPDGKYVLSTVKDRSVFVALDNLEYSQLFFPIKGIIAYYDRENKKYTELNGASNRSLVQSNPNWSPDGKEILFCRTNRYTSGKIENSTSVILNVEDVKEFTSGQKDFKFDIYRLPFNEGRGGEPVALKGASDNGNSNFFARYSPDGKWIVFCQAENFMLLQPDSKLYIIPSEGGTPRLMKCNRENMNSWHSWSPNSRWLVFSSKAQGPYTQLYLTHIDKNGMDSPPVNLENLHSEKRAANIPEFMNPSSFSIVHMTDSFSNNAIYHNRLATINIGEKQYEQAYINLNNAIQADSNFYEAYRNRIALNNSLGRSMTREDLKDKETALRLINIELKRAPQSASLLLRRAELFMWLQNYPAALTDLAGAIKTGNLLGKAYDMIIEVYRRSNQSDKAIPYLRKQIALHPDNLNTKYRLALLYYENNRTSAAFEILNRLILESPGTSAFYISRAKLFELQGNMLAAKNNYDQAVNAEPENYTVYIDRARFFLRNSNQSVAMNDFNTAMQGLDKNIQKSPQDASLLLNKANLKEQMGDIRGALSDYNTYLKKWPLNFTVLKKKAMLCYSLKMWQPCIEVLTLVVNNFAADATIYFSRCMAFQQSGNIQGAINDINEAIRLNANEPSYYYSRAGLRKSSGDAQGFINDLKMAQKQLTDFRRIRELKPEELKLLNMITPLLAGN